MKKPAAERAHRDVLFHYRDQGEYKRPAPTARMPQTDVVDVNVSCPARRTQQSPSQAIFRERTLKPFLERLKIED